MPRTVFHIDANSFFASCELLDHPELRGVPMAVAGSGERTVILSPTYEARASGVKTGMRKFEALAVCPHLIIVETHNSRYVELSRAMIDIFRQYTPVVEVYSIDESFLDMTGMDRLYGALGPVGREIQRRILDELGLPTSVGIGPNKLVAKWAAKVYKPRGFLEVSADEAEERLRNVPVGALWGIGRRLTIALNEMGIFTCGQLGNYSVKLLRAKFGINGERFREWGRGIDHRPVETVVPPPKSIGHSMTFVENVPWGEELDAYLWELSERVARRSRNYGFRGREISASVRLPDLSWCGQHRLLSASIDDGRVLYQTAREVLDHLRPRLPKGTLFRAAGVGLARLEADGRALSLWHEDRQQVLVNAALDGLCDRYGEWVVTRGTALHRSGHRGVIAPAWRPEGIHSVEFPE